MLRNTKKIKVSDNRQRTLCITMFFAFVLCTLSVCFTFISRTDLSQMLSLLCSSYDYSAITNQAIEKDCYYRFQNDIYFALSDDFKANINADVLMQSKVVEYTNRLDWNTERLSSDEIAISSALAQNYGLREGDKLYSKNPVYGEVREYKIKEIIPLITEYRTREHKNSIYGIILMGEDESYIDNLVSQFIIYTDMTPDQLNSKYSNMPTDLVYRRTEIKIELGRVIPRFVIFIGMGIVISWAFCYVLMKTIKKNFIRQIILGYDMQVLYHAYRGHLLKFGLYGFVISAAFGMIIFSFLGYIGVELLNIGSVLVTGIIMMIITIEILIKRLWGGT